MTQAESNQSTEQAPDEGVLVYGRVLSAGELLEEAIKDAVEAMGFEVVVVDWAGAARHRVVRVYLDVGRDAHSAHGALRVEEVEEVEEVADGDEGSGAKPKGITLDDITRLSPIVSNALDAAEADPEATALQRLLKTGYTLEVSSPGIERPLAKADHFTRFVGCRVSVRTFEPLEADSKQRGFHGYIKAHEPDPIHPDDPRGGAVILDEADGDGTIRIPLTAIKRAHLVYED